MAKQGAKTATPRLRFPEFYGAVFRHKRLNELAVESTARNYGRLQVTAVMGVSKTDGIVPMQERLIGADIERYKIVQKNWFAYNPMRLNIGSIAQWVGAEDVLVSPDYVVFKCIENDAKGLDSSYLNQFR
jgi:type I restriction enzyme S subunit